jgi:hypothetical protein
MMKITYKKYAPVIAAAIIFCAAGCKKDFLDTKYDIYATPGSISTDRGTLFTFAYAFYTPLPYGFTSLDGNFFAAATDEAQRAGNVPTGTLAFNDGTLSQINVPADETANYRNFYEGIRAANFYIEYSKNWREFLARNRDTITDLNYPRDKRLVGWFRGEARIARAYYYAELAKRYGGVPIITQTLEQNGGQVMPRSSYDEVVNYIVTEIDKYKDSLQVNWKTSGDKDQDGRFAKGSALALKARVLLYAASPLNNPANDVTKWQKAAEAARDVITTTGLNFGLYTGGYRNYFIGNASITSGNPETIMAVRRPAANTPELANYPISTAGGNSGIAIA